MDNTFALFALLNDDDILPDAFSDCIPLSCLKTTAESSFTPGSK
jgi:hypothetical protein